MFKDLLNKPLPSKSSDLFAESAGYLTESEVDDLVDDLDAAGMVNDDEDIPMPVDDVGMTQEESEEADRVIDMAATPIVLKELLDDKEMTEFVGSYEFDIACNEGFLLESDVTSLTGEYTEEMLEYMTEAKLYNKTKIQMSIKDRFAQLFEISVLGCARAKNDPDYIRLVKIQKARRTLKKRLRAKYRTPALQKARMYLQRLKKSRSGVVAKAAAKITSR